MNTEELKLWQHLASRRIIAMMAEFDQISPHFLKAG
jgi:hypothetical protein